MKLSLSTWLDLVFCIAVLPALLLVHPVASWAAWHASYVLLFTLWLYGLYFLHRRVTGRALLSGRPHSRRAAAAGVFLTFVFNFMLTLTRVSFPRNLDEISRLAPHQQAMWVLFLAVSAYSLAVGLLSIRIEQLQEALAARQQAQDLAHDIAQRSGEAVADGILQVKSGYEDVTIPLAQIRYIESRNNYACFHLDHREDIVTQQTLKSLMESLPEGKFVRIHRSYIVPVYRIGTTRASSVRIVGVDEPLPVGRAYKETFRKAVSAPGATPPPAPSDDRPSRP